MILSRSWSSALGATLALDMRPRMAQRAVELTSRNERATKREVPLLTFLFGAFFVLSNFITWGSWKTAAESVNNWVTVVIAFTYVWASATS